MHKLDILKNVELIQKILEADELPDLETLRQYKVDFTKEPLPLSDDQLKPENMPTYQRIKKTMKPFLRENMKDMGRAAPESCFSKDDPVEVFLNYLREYVAREIVCLENEGVDKKIVSKFLRTKRKDMSVDDYVNSAVKKLHQLYQMKAVIDMEKELPAASDFNSSKGVNYPEQSYRRKWKHDLHAASLDDENDTEGVRQEIENDPKLTAHPDEEAINHVSIEEFMRTLSPEERKMIALRLQGKAYEDIAKELNVQDHSAVVKRMRRLGEKFEHSTGIDCGFSEKKKKSSYNSAR